MIENVIDGDECTFSHIMQFQQQQQQQQYKTRNNNPLSTKNLTSTTFQGFNLYPHFDFSA